MEFHAPNFGDDFGLNQYPSAVTTTVTPTADVVTTSYYVPSTQSYVHTSAGLYQTTDTADMMSFGTHEIWSPAHVTQVHPYQQQYTNLSVQGVQAVQMAPQATHLQSLQVAGQQQPQQAAQAAVQQQQQQTSELTRESSPMAGSPDSYGTSSGGGPIKKQKQAKKKRDPNEPKKPLSAYAMFFRDTQAAIKGQNPSASFGEVSKIVASMWESLEADKKNSYKQKAEDAKKEYLKALTAYKANLVAQSAGAQDNSMPSPPQPAQPPTPVSVPQTPPAPSTFSQTVMIEQHHPAQWAAQQMAQQPQQPVQIIYAQHSNVHLQAQQQTQQLQQQSQHNGLPALPDYHLSSAGGQMGSQLHNQYATTLNVQVPGQVHTQLGQMVPAQVGQVGQVQMVSQSANQQHLTTTTSQPLQTQAGQQSPLVHMSSAQTPLVSQSQQLMAPQQQMVVPHPSAAAMQQQQQAQPQPQMVSQQQLDTTGACGLLTPPVSVGSQPIHSPAQTIVSQPAQVSQAGQQVMHVAHQPQQQQPTSQQHMEQQQAAPAAVQQQQRAAPQGAPAASPVAAVQNGQEGGEQRRSPAAPVAEPQAGQETKEAFNQQQQRLAAAQAAAAAAAAANNNGVSGLNGTLNNNEPLTPKSEEANGGLCSHKPMCRRKGCGNAAVECAEWDKEYCSNECVVSHCREVFSSWVGQRQTGPPTGPPVVSQ